MVLMTGCASTPTATIDTSNVNPEDLLSVDCLLPPQVRQLGTRITYLAPRRPIRTSGALCAIRGGEYVAYDRADFKSALSVWLPQAEKGDALAQTYVGEIYEKGLGTRESYDLAALWYQRAADQGYSRAQINLGYLYESGLGVRKDLTRAMNLYREASGFIAGNLEYVSSIEVANREAAVVESQVLQTRVVELEEELQAANRLYAKQQQEIRRKSREVASLRDEVQSQRQRVSLNISTDKLDNGTIDGNTSASVIAARQTAQSLQKIAQLESQLDAANSEQQKLTGQLATQKLETATLRQQYTANNQQIFTLQQELKRNAISVEQLESRLAQQDQTLSTLPAELADAKQISRLLENEIETLRSSRAAQANNIESLLAAAQNSESALNNAIDQQNDEINRLRTQQVKEQQRYRRDIELLQKQLSGSQDEQQRLTGRLAQQQLAEVEKLAELEMQLSARESEIGEQRAALDSLQQSVSNSRNRLNDRPSESITQIASAGPSIDIIDPPVLLTRGAPTLPQPANQSEFELIGKINPPESLFEFKINGKSHPVDDSGLFRYSQRSATASELEFVAIDNSGASTRLALVLGDAADTRTADAGQQSGNLIGPRLALTDVEFGNYYALIIGNDTYASMTPLKTARNDAVAVERLFREKYGFKTELLLNADHRSMLVALDRMRSTLGENDNLVIYYAGHGELDEESGRGYWLPVDASASNDDKWIANSAVTGIIENMAAKHVLVIADSCYSGTLTRSSVARALPDVTSEQKLRWLKAVSRSRVRTVLSSGGVKPVFDGSPEARHSVFAQVFIDELQQNTDVLEVYKLFFDVQQKVAKAAAALNVDQTPQYAPIRHSGHEAGEFLFVPENQKTVDASDVLFNWPLHNWSNKEAT